MFFLYKFKEAGHIRAAEVVDGLQTGEHRRLGQPLEMVLANVLRQCRKCQKCRETKFERTQ